ncbi:CD1845 family protein [Desulfitobacterium sp. PCE1]|uniref:CD1845 family protein n=1 Tax=Desulfitobacterium sp. PCE1 TaxID=146907 RepID=UPI00037914A8
MAGHPCAGIQEAGGPSGTALTTAAVAFLISPYGIPKLAEWFIDRLDDLNCAIKSI